MASKKYIPPTDYDEQMTLFDAFEPEAEVKEPEPKIEGLDKWAFLYTAGRSGHNSGIRFMMTLEDAQKWCSSDLSHGNLHGNPWAYFYTSVENFCYCHWGQLKNVSLDLRKLYDNGEWDERIESLGLKKYGIKEIKEILSEYGIEVLINRYEYIPSLQECEKEPPDEVLRKMMGDRFDDLYSRPEYAPYPQDEKE